MVLANPILTVYIQYVWQEFHQIYGHMRFWPTLNIRCTCSIIGRDFIRYTGIW